MWRALDSYNPQSGALPAWLTTKAKYRMTEVVTRGNWSGLPARRDGRNAIQNPVTLSLDAERDGITLADVIPDDGNVLEEVLNAYHHGEIHQALSELTPAQRKYVHARFWLGMSAAEMKKEIFGYDPSGLWNSPKNGAKLKLKERLETLSHH